MKAHIKQTNEFFATTLAEAEGIVTEAKQDFATSVVNHSITRKEKKGLEYFIIKITVEHAKAKDLLEGLAE